MRAVRSRQPQDARRRNRHPVGLLSPVSTTYLLAPRLQCTRPLHAPGGLNARPRGRAAITAHAFVLASLRLVLRLILFALPYAW